MHILIDAEQVPVPPDVIVIPGVPHPRSTAKQAPQRSAPVQITGQRSAVPQWTLTV